MKVKVFDEAHEKDLEESINNFIEDVDVIDIKYLNKSFFCCLKKHLFEQNIHRIKIGGIYVLQFYR